jgi:hypothetical protein
LGLVLRWRNQGIAIGKTTVGAATLTKIAEATADVTTTVRDGMEEMIGTRIGVMTGITAMNDGTDEIGMIEILGRIRVMKSGIMTATLCRMAIRGGGIATTKVGVETETSVITGGAGTIGIRTAGMEEAIHGHPITGSATRETASATIVSTGRKEQTIKIPGLEAAARRANETKTTTGQTIAANTTTTTNAASAQEQLRMDCRTGKLGEE